MWTKIWLLVVCYTICAHLSERSGSYQQYQQSSYFYRNFENNSYFRERFRRDQHYEETFAGYNCGSRSRRRFVYLIRMCQQSKGFGLPTHYTSCKAVNHATTFNVYSHSVSDVGLVVHRIHTIQTHSRAWLDAGSLKRDTISTQSTVTS